METHMNHAKALFVVWRTIIISQNNWNMSVDYVFENRTFDFNFIRISSPTTIRNDKDHTKNRFNSYSYLYNRWHNSCKRL